MLKKKQVRTLLSSLLLCLFSIACTPAIANDSNQSFGLPKHYLAQNDQSEGEEEQVESEDAKSESEDSGQAEESVQSESTDASSEASESSGPFTTLLSLLMGQGDGRPVSLASLAVQFIGVVFLIVLVVSIPIGFNCAFCALIWKIGMVARGGKKPDIG